MVEVVAAVIVTDGLINCFKKGASKYEYLSFKYEFPGGKVEPLEDHTSALVREIKEELETDIVVNRFLITADHQYPDFSVRLHFYECSALTEIKTLTEHIELVQLPRERLMEIDWLPADVPAVEFLMKNE